MDKEILDNLQKQRQDVIKAINKMRNIVSKNKIVIDPDFVIQLASSHDDLKHRIEHLESHIEDDPSELPVAPGFFFNATFMHPVPLKKRKAYMEQFQAELLSVFKEYDVIGFEGIFTQ
jgi:hypothetical protein